ncbi:hypothetical protein ACOSP7_007218 [Xanthoceras sorbifolium]
MLVTYGKNGRNGPNGYSGSRGYAGYPADKGKNSGKFQSVKVGMGSIAAPSGTGGSVDKVQGAAKDGIKAVFDNYHKESSVSKKGVAVNSGVAQGSRFDVFLNDLREGNLVLFDKKSKGKKHISSAEGGPNIGGKKVLADISNKVENSVKGSVFGIGTSNSVGSDSSRPVVDIAEGSFDVVASYLKEGMEVALE